MLNYPLPPAVLPPVLVPRNPQPISSFYEPTPSYMDSQRATYSPNNEAILPVFDSPGELNTFIAAVCP